MQPIFPTGCPAPQLCCSFFRQGDPVVVAQKWKPYKSLCPQHRGSPPRWCTETKSFSLLSSVNSLPVVHTTAAHTASVWAACPGFTSHGNKRARTAVVLMHAGSHCNIGRDVARGHSQTWEFGSSPRFPYTVTALLSEGQKWSHWQQEASRQEAWRQAQWGVRAHASLPFLELSSSHEGVTENNDHFTQLENARADQKSGAASTQGVNR